YPSLPADSICDLNGKSKLRGGRPVGLQNCGIAEWDVQALHRPYELEAYRLPTFLTGRKRRSLDNSCLVHQAARIVINPVNAADRNRVPRLVCFRHFGAPWM